MSRACALRALAPKPAALRPQRVQRWQAGERRWLTDALAEEVAVALCYNGVNHAVMMATPLDLEAFALGFSLSEGIIDTPEQLYGIEIREFEQGIELDLQIASRCALALKSRRRQLTGRTGCGLCGADSLAAAIRPLARVSPTTPPDDSAIQRALAELPARQPLQQQTGAAHAAAWCDATGAIRWIKEDVGRHNALDKLIGTLVRQQQDTRAGFLLMSSRASYEIVHKAAAADLGNLVTLSAPTALAADLATQAGIHLVGFARPGRHNRYGRDGSTAL